MAGWARKQINPAAKVQAITLLAIGVDGSVAARTLRETVDAVTLSLWESPGGPVCILCNNGLSLQGSDAVIRWILSYPAKSEVILKGMDELVKKCGVAVFCNVSAAGCKRQCPKGPPVDLSAGTQEFFGKSSLSVCLEVPRDNVRD